MSDHQMIRSRLTGVLARRGLQALEQDQASYSPGFIACRRRSTRTDTTCLPRGFIAVLCGFRGFEDIDLRGE